MHGRSAAARRAVGQASQSQRRFWDGHSCGDGPARGCGPSDPPCLVDTMLLYLLAYSDLRLPVRRRLEPAGIRNSVGMDWHPSNTGPGGARLLYFTDNGRDSLGNDMPDDELNVADRCAKGPPCSVMMLLCLRRGRGGHCAHGQETLPGAGEEVKSPAVTVTDRVCPSGLLIAVSCALLIRRGLFFGFPYCHTGGIGDPYKRTPGAEYAIADPELNKDNGTLNCAPGRRSRERGPGARMGG